MQVWIVEYGFTYEPTHIWGVYETEELALKVTKNKYFADYDYVEVIGYQVRKEAK
jgi:hypothetical protein